MSEITDERLTEIENAALKGLLDLVYAAWCLADDSEDLGDGYHKVDHANMVKLCEALDALDELPDDQPGYTMAEAAKAKWALRRLLAAQERRASSPAADEALRFERDLLQRLCAKRAYALDEIGEAAVASEYLPDLVSKIGRILQTASSISSESLLPSPAAGRDAVIEECARVAAVSEASDDVGYTNQEVDAYEDAARDIAANIRSLKETPNGN